MALSERQALQVATTLAGLVPVTAGLAGVIVGPSFVAGTGDISVDSHFRYLSGLLLGLGLAVWLSVPRIERYRQRFALIGSVVAIGGVARLASMAAGGVPNAGMLFGLAMELLVTPAICIWQSRVARLTGERGHAQA
ncbi:MAG: DUF4345 domain-containing protein [Bauldia sp.]